MEGEIQVKVYGMWASTFSKRVELALKIKGIPYEYVEEDLQNKSQALLEYNPVHKKVPVLVHNGKALVESLVILEYIEEAWPNHGPRLLPDDPYERAMVRFWANYLHDQMLESIRTLFVCNEEAREKALNEVHENMTIMEKEIMDFFPKDASSIKQESLRLLDIQLIAIFGAYKAQEEVIGKKILDPEKHPRIYACVNALMNLPVVQGNTPSHDKLVPLLKYFINSNQGDA